MNEFFGNTLFFGALISLMSYGIGMLLKNKLRLAIFNPLLVAIVLTLGFVLIFDIDYEVYNSGAKYLSYLLTPATVCLAIPLYEQFESLRKNAVAILVGIVTGFIPLRP